jgi:hypothetical protein
MKRETRVNCQPENDGGDNSHFVCLFFKVSESQNDNFVGSHQSKANLRAVAIFDS